MDYRGHSIDDNISYDDKGRKFISIGIYRVIQVKKDFVGIYSQCGTLITHCAKWKRATKIAKLLLDSYCDGYEDREMWYY